VERLAIITAFLIASVIMTIFTIKPVHCRTSKH